MNLASIMKSRPLRDAFETGRKRGRDEGRRELVEQVLCAQLARYLGRPLTPEEHQTLAARLSRQQALHATDLLLLDPESLWTWLFGPPAA